MDNDETVENLKRTLLHVGGRDVVVTQDDAKAIRAALLEWLGRTRNDLQGPALRLAPVIGDCLAALAGQGADFIRMSGSGATCFGIFADGADAGAAAARLAAARPDWWVRATRTIEGLPLAAPQG